jgi:hypothetical protein
MYIKSYGASETFNYYLTNNYIKLNGGGEYGQDGQPIFMADCEIGTEFNGMEIQEKIQSLIINSNTFNNVIKVKITASKQYQPVYTNDTYLYFEENVGLIKKVIDLGNSEFESYSIKDWNLIK